MLGCISGLTAALLLLSSKYATAQFPATPEDVTVLKSKLNDGVYISYREPGICETTPGVKSYAGYVHLPPGTLNDLDERQNYSINTFFWFFEARKDPHNAPLSIWMNGGPGSSSLLGLLSENGPCSVNPDSNSTTLNPWSWNNEVNMLYIDQPVQVGLSYDKLQNITYNAATGDIEFLDPDQPIPEQNSSFRVGTYPSQDRGSTSVGTLNAARALWHFAQTWFQEFPGYCPNDSRISIATESYGGRYGPAYSAFFEEQNQKIENGTWTEAGDMYIIHMDTLLIINGCIDRQVQWPAYPHIVFNNTYGIQALNESVYESMVDAYYRSGGCRDQINDCRALAAQYDPTQRGLNASVNKVCQSAETFCSKYLRDPYTEYSGRNYYDFGTLDPDPFPPPWYYGFLNQPHVQRALGVPLNFSQSSSAVSYDFRSIGDYPRDGWLQDLSYLLDNGIKVALVYGDRDFACNWLGGELVSLAVDYTYTNDFHAAGYAPLLANKSSPASSAAGRVRQHGNFSFTRVYEAGHEVPAYQPEAAYNIFTRALFNRDISTGEINTAVNGDYSTEGPASSFGFKNEPPTEQPLQICYIWDMEDLCTADQIEAVANGSALVRNNFVVDKNSTTLYPALVGPPEA